MTLLLGSSLTVMAGAAISPVLPQIYSAFSNEQSSDLLVKLTLTLPALFIGLFAPLMGYLLDVWGRKPVLILALLIYAIAGSSGLYLNSLEGILVGRALLGIAVAGIMSGFTTLIGDYFQGQKLARFMGYHGTFMSFGGILFLVGGGWLADFGWRYPFSLYLSALFLFPLLLVFVSEPAFKQSSAGAHKVAGLPIKKMSLIYLLAFVIMALVYFIPVHIAFYLNQMEPISGAKIGVIMAALTLASATTSYLFSRYSRILNSHVCFCSSYTLMGVGLLIISLSGSSSLVLVGIVLVGLGFGLWVPTINVWLVSGLAPEIRGKVVGGFTTFFFLGQFFSPIISQPLIQWKGIAASFIAGPVLLFPLAAIYLWLIFSTRRDSIS
nr:MFS transporter [Oleiphilus messinensis]